MEKFAPTPTIPIKDAKFTRARSQTPTKSSPDRRPSTPDNVTMNLGFNDIPMATSHYTRRGDFNEFLKTSSSDDDDDLNRDPYAPHPFSEANKTNPYQKPLPYFQFSLNRYKQEVPKISAMPSDKTLLVSQLKENESLHPVKNDVPINMVQSQYAKHNLPAFLTNKPELWEQKDKELKRITKNLTFEYTNKRFLQPKPAPNNSEDAGRRYALPRTVKPKVKYSDKNEKQQLGKR